MTLRPLGLVAGLLSIAMVSACGGAGGRGAGDDRLKVVAAFYPLQYALTQIGGDARGRHRPDQAGRRAARPRAQPRAGGRRSPEADLVVYETHFQPAVDDAVDGQAGATGFDVSAAAGSTSSRPRTGTTTVARRAAADATADDRAPVDPHFWLDPMRFADVGDAIADRARRARPGQRRRHTRRTPRPSGPRLTALDTEFRGRPEDLRDRRAGHRARRVRLPRAALRPAPGVGSPASAPDAEPSPPAMARARPDTSARHGVTHRLRRDAGQPGRRQDAGPRDRCDTGGARPDRGHHRARPPAGLPQVMRANLRALRAGQDCS